MTHTGHTYFISLLETFDKLVKQSRERTGAMCLRGCKLNRSRCPWDRGMESVLGLGPMLKKCPHKRKSAWLASVVWTARK